MGKNERKGTLEWSRIYIIYMRIKCFAYGCVIFFTRVEMHATGFRFDKFGSYIKMLKRSSRSVRRQRYIGRRVWKTPVIYIHFGMRFTIIIIIYYIVYTVVVVGGSGAVQQHREMYSLSIYNISAYTSAAPIVKTTTVPISFVYFHKLITLFW